MARQQEVGADVVPELVRALVMKAHSSDLHLAAIEEYAELIGIPTGLGPAIGTEAPDLALRAVGIGPPREFILPANTLAATAEAAVRAGARHALVDVDAGTLLMDTNMVGRAVGPRTQAIVPVHLFGHTAPVEALVPLAVHRGLALVEDIAQVQGVSIYARSAGSLGHIAGTSFHPGKHLGATACAGAVTANYSILADKPPVLAELGSLLKYVHDIAGFTSRLGALQAIVGRAKLQWLTGFGAYTCSCCAPRTVKFRVLTTRVLDQGRQ